MRLASFAAGLMVFSAAVLIAFEVWQTAVYLISR